MILIWRGRCDDGGRRQERKWEFFLRIASLRKEEKMSGGSSVNTKKRRGEDEGPLDTKDVGCFTKTLFQKTLPEAQRTQGIDSIS